MSKKKKQNKKKPKAPSLSKLDKWIYKIGYVVIFVAVFAALILLLRLTQSIAFQNEMVIASRERATLLWSLPFFLYAMLSAFIFWVDAHGMKKPIFGNSDVTYGKAPFQHIYPLFSKERKKRTLPPSYKKYRRNTFLLWFSGFMICIFLALFGLFGRVSLRQNGDVTVYDVFNNEKQQYTVEDISEMKISASKHTSGRGASWWRVSIAFTMNDGKTYAFSSAEFSPNWETFEAMIQTKSLIDRQKITIQGVENLDKVIDDHNYTPEEIKLLYELFEVLPE